MDKYDDRILLYCCGIEGAVKNNHPDNILYAVEKIRSVIREYREFPPKNKEQPPNASAVDLWHELMRQYCKDGQVGQWVARNYERIVSVLYQQPGPSGQPTSAMPKLPTWEEVYKACFSKLPNGDLGAHALRVQAGLKAYEFIVRQLSA